MAHILVVEDDELFRSVLKNVLIGAGHKVTEAQDGLVAQRVFDLTACDLVISDARMPNLDGIALLQWVKAKKQDMPFVLMTGFSELLETKSAAEYGADAFLTKPFEQNQVIQDVNRLLLPDSGKDSEEKEKEETQYISIPIDDFVSGSEIPYSIFIRLNNDKYVRLAHRGEDLALNRIESYKEKGIFFLYLNRDDYRKYVGFMTSLGKLVSGSKKISKEKKQNFMRASGEVIMQKLFLDKVDSAAFEISKAYVENSLDILSDNEDTMNLLMSLNNHSDHLYAHSLGVSQYAVMIGRAMGWRSNFTLFKVSVGGIYHDIGKKEIDRALLEKPRDALSQPEIKLLESHVMRGVEILSRIKTFPSDILQIVYEHHEDCLGYGYPRGLKKSSIHPMARVVAVANRFCELTIRGPNSEGLAPDEAIQKLFSFNSQELDPEPLNALRKLFRP